MKQEETYRKLEKILKSRALFGEENVLPYAKDESDLGIYLPDAVALVDSVEELQEILKLAEKDKIFVTPRGLGSGKTGGALALKGGIVLSTERLNHIKEVDEESLFAVVEPGVVTAELHRQVEEKGLFYPPDPASLDVCSLGGNVAENAGGPRAFKYGVTREYILALDVIAMGGSLKRFGRPTVKHVTGLDLVGLMTGSEGVLGVISDITLKLIPKPPQTLALLAVFKDVLSASHAVTQLLSRGYRPSALELMDEVVVDHLQSQKRWPLPKGRSALLLVELDGEAETLEAQLLHAGETCQSYGATDISVATDEAKRRRLWEMRRQVSTMLGEMHAYRVAEDICVPRARIPQMLKRIDGLATKYNTAIASYGHAGDGNLHVNIVYDDADASSRISDLLKELFVETIKLGGTLSGEHGIGLAKKEYMPLEQSKDVLTIQKEIKKLFDPNGLLNPGKIFP